MKVKFSREVTVTPSWNGNETAEEKFTATMKPVAFGELLEVLDAFQAAGIAAGAVDTSQLDGKVIRNILDACSGVLNKYVTLRNLQDEQGVELTIKDVVTYGPFMMLAMELVGRLVQISTPTEEDEGN